MTETLLALLHGGLGAFAAVFTLWLVKRKRNRYMRVKYDDVARAGYITIGPQDNSKLDIYTETLDAHAHIFADYSAETNELVGIEIIE